MTRAECLEILELPANSSRDNIVTTYRQLVQVWHPDRFPNNPELQGKANAKLSQINEAYNVLISGRDSANDPFAPHRDEQVKYSGCDPRLKPTNSIIPAVVEVSSEGMTLVTLKQTIVMFKQNQAAEVACYPRETLLAAQVGNDRWIRNGVEMKWPGPQIDEPSPETIILQFADPEGILKRPIVVNLRLRNTYYAQLLLKRLQPSTGWTKWVPPPEPPRPPQPHPTTPLPHAQPRQPSTNLATNPLSQGSSSDSSDTKETKGDVLVRLLTTVTVLIIASLIVVAILGVVFFEKPQNTEIQSAIINSANQSVTPSSASSGSQMAVIPAIQKSAEPPQFNSSSSRSGVNTAASIIEHTGRFSSPSPFPSRIKIWYRRGDKRESGFVRFSNLAPDDPTRYRKQETVSVRSDRKIADTEQGGIAGTISSGTVGEVVDRKGDDISITFPLSPPLDRVKLKHWQIRHVGYDERFEPGERVWISADGTTPLLDESGKEIGQLKDGTIVYVFGP